MGTILQVCAYGAEYAGNFISSLTSLEKDLLGRGYTTIYAFCEKAKKKDWCIEIEKRTKVYYLPEAKARILPRTYYIFKQIFHDNDVCLVHTHFELYDIPATIMAPKNIKIFWHLHDPLTFSNSLRGILWRIQYGVVGKNAKLIAVSDYYRNEVVKIGFSEKASMTVLNGIDTGRLNYVNRGLNSKYDFLTMGWDFFRKGDDIILEACRKLVQDGYEFKVLLNGNNETWDKLTEYTNGEDISYIIKGSATPNVAELYASARCFIQASRKETFSYAVCEAAYSGMPVICSNISGLEWARELPTVQFFENEDVNGLYLLMKQFLDGQKYNVSAFQKTESIIENEYSTQAWVKKIMKIYGL